MPESILIEYYDLVTEKLNTLKDHGVRVTLDNFGKGYSALNYLRKLPITSVKLDKTFSDIITIGEESRILTDFMIKLAGAHNCISSATALRTGTVRYLIRNGCKGSGILYKQTASEGGIEAAGGCSRMAGDADAVKTEE